MEVTKTPKGYKQTKLGIIPEDWEVKGLGELCTIKGEYGINAAAVSYDENLPTYLRITDIDERGNYIEEGKKSVDSPEYHKFVLKNNDIVFARTGNTTGKTYLHKNENGELIFAGFLIRFRTDNQLLSPKYLKLYTNTSKYWSWVRVFSMRSGQPGINGKEYSQLPIPLPPLPEQKTIAKILSTWDKAIETQTAHIDKKKLYKKALMQRLFKPKDDWKEVRLGEVIKVKHGKNQKKVIDKNGEYPILGTGGLMGYANSYLWNKPSVLIGRKGTINKPQYMDTPFWTVDTLFYTDISKRISPKWLYYQFWMINWKKYNEASGVPSLSASTISNIKIHLPNLQTQTKIANILSSADKEISILEQQLVKLKEQKRGLMQVLLTGKKRVKLENN